MEDEVPPEQIWEDQQGLEQWWAAVKDKRDSGSGMPSKSSSSEESDDGEEWGSNDLARILKDG